MQFEEHSQLPHLPMEQNPLKKLLNLPAREMLMLQKLKDRFMEQLGSTLSRDQVKL